MIDRGLDYNEFLSWFWLYHSPELARKFLRSLWVKSSWIGV